MPSSPQQACESFESVHGIISSSFNFGDLLMIGVQVDVEAEVDGWLHCVNRYGVKGLVPSSYIRILGADDAAEDVASRLFGGPQRVGAPSSQSTLYLATRRNTLYLWFTIGRSGHCYNL